MWWPWQADNSPQAAVPTPQQQHTQRGEGGLGRLAPSCPMLRISGTAPRAERRWLWQQQHWTQWRLAPRGAGGWFLFAQGPAPVRTAGSRLAQCGKVGPLWTPGSFDGVEAGASWAGGAWPGDILRLGGAAAEGDPAAGHGPRCPGRGPPGCELRPVWRRHCSTLAKHTHLSFI